MMRGVLAACSRCLPCRQARGRVLVTRLLVESLGHDHKCLITLTYADPHLPAGRNLDPAQLAAAVRRLRFNFEHRTGARLRLFPVGEYGGQSGRPHYHAIVWGADHLTDCDGRSFPELVEAAWPFGRVDVGKYFSEAAAGYISGYVAKGHNLKGHFGLYGRHPEFVRFPCRPALGVPGLKRLLPLLLDGRDPLAVIAAHGDLPGVARLGNQDRPLGGYLLDLLRKEAGLSSLEVLALKDARKGAQALELRERALDVALERALDAMDFDTAGSLQADLATFQLASRADAASSFRLARILFGRSCSDAT